MKKIIFYVEPKWAFGVIHYELCKYLFNLGYNCQVLAWNQSYTREEMFELDDGTDLYVTTPHGYRTLKYSYGTIDPSKVVAVVHAPLDCTDLIHHHGLEDFDKLRKFAVISDFLIEEVKKLGINRVPELISVGINCQSFNFQPSNSLNVVGYAGSHKPRGTFSQEDINSYLHQPVFHKRSYLVEEAAAKANLSFRAASTYHNTHITMPGFYKNVDAVICSSTQEGAGLPVLEAGAAGKLVISTPVGHWDRRVAPAGGDTVPIPEEEFMEKTVELLNYYKSNPDRYRERCREIQHHAQSYDWKHVIDKWIALLD